MRAVAAAVAAVACALSGCLASLVEDSHMGERRERARYERATGVGDRLFLFYSVGRDRSHGDARWSVIDLSGLTWDVLTPHGTKLGLNSIALSVEDDPRHIHSRRRKRVG